MGSGRSPLAQQHAATSPPPPPSPNSKSEDSLLSDEEAPLQLIAHPACDEEDSAATPMMICNFLQLTLNEPPSSTKISAETDFMAMAKQQLFVSELPTPVTLMDGTPAPCLVPGVSLQACTGGRQAATHSNSYHSSHRRNPSPLEFNRSTESTMQMCGGLASPQQCRFSSDQPKLVDAATSPGSPAHAHGSQCSSRASSSKAASEQAAVELCQTPFQGCFPSTCSGTPVHVPPSPAPASCMAGLRRGLLSGSVCVAEDGPDGRLQSGTPQLQCPADSADEAARTPRLHVMGSALSPLLRDACGRNAKSVLKDLLAALVEQEQALDAQGSADRTERMPPPKIANITPVPKYDGEAFAEETVDIVASPLHRDALVHAPVQGPDLEGASTGSGLDAVDPLTFDAVYDEAVQLHLTAGMDRLETEQSKAVLLDYQGDCCEDRLEFNEQPIDSGQCGAGVGSFSNLLAQDHTMSPATTRVSTFSVRSALSCDIHYGPGAVDSTADVDAWLRTAKPRASGGCRRSGGKARQAVRGSREAGPGCWPAVEHSVPHARSIGTSSTGRKAPVQSGSVSVVCVRGDAWHTSPWM